MRFQRFYIAIFFALLYVFSGFNPVHATEEQREVYEADWSSLNARPVAPWFEDAKFGIFIHWGVYSVPANTPNGTYSEWYQYWLQGKSLFGNTEEAPDAVAVEHERIYGKDVSYYDLAENFKAELFQPDEWVDTFEQAGAKYVITTSKHHDGFALWPNSHASKAYGQPWNSVEVGPKRDLIGDLKAAFEKSPLKFGLYYSMYEWYHPDWQDEENRARFVDQHTIPQFKEMVKRYQPDLIYADGEWDMPSSDWRSEEILAWLFNDSPIASTVVINDRWGKDERGVNGGYYTTEYENDKTFDHPWEEIRGLGTSFGYNRAEGAEDYNSSQTFILMLADIVSRGGNLCLNVGPRADGKIPPIMEYHLLEIGKWLKRNGESIYGTRKWSTPIQWGAGEQNYEHYLKERYKRYIGGEYILKQTLDVPEGYAAKEAFFTRNGSDLFVILPKWHDRFTLKDIRLLSGAKATLLANGQSVAIIDNGADTVLDLPEFDPNAFHAEDHYAFVIKIKGALSDSE